jgi:hypothetical protein
MGKARLRPGGIWSQWVQMYGMDTRDLQSILRTFATVFPNVLVFSTIDEADLVMLGSDAPLKLTFAQADALAHRTPELTRELAAVGIDDGYDFLSNYLFDRDDVLWRTHGIPLNTDDNLLVEYSAPKHLHQATSLANFEMLRRWMRTPVALVDGAGGCAELALAYADRDDLVRAMVALQAAEAREPGRPDVAELVKDVRRRWQEEHR